MLYSQSLIELNKNFNDNLYKMINMNNDTIKNLINLVTQNNVFNNNNFTNNFQSPMGQISFLQKKRLLENSNLNPNNLFQFQKNTNINAINTNNIQLNIDPKDINIKFDISSHFMRPKLFYNENIYNFNKPELNNYAFNYLIPGTKEIKFENNYFFNNNINNIFNKLNGNQDNDFILNKNKTIINDKKNLNENINENNNSTDMSNSTPIPNNDSIIKKKNYFNITHIKNEKSKKKKK